MFTIMSHRPWWQVQPRLRLARAAEAPAEAPSPTSPQYEIEDESDPEEGLAPALGSPPVVAGASAGRSESTAQCSES